MLLRSLLLAIWAGTASPVQSSSLTALPAACANFGDGLEIRVCSQVAYVPPRSNKRSTTWRVWIEGTREPIELRLHDDTPSVVELEGGSDQVAVSSGGARNELSRRVVFLLPGGRPYGLSARPHYRIRPREAAAIAEAIAPLLKKLQSRFAQERNELPTDLGSPSRDYAAEPLEALLTRTHAALQEIFSYSELAALRDHAAESFQAFRASLVPVEGDESRTGFERHSRRSGAIALVALASPDPIPPPLTEARLNPPKPRAISRESGDSALDGVTKLIGSYLGFASHKQLLTDICMQSEPAGVQFTVYPRSYPEDAHQTTTNHLIEGLYRGLYSYTAKFTPKSLVCDARLVAGTGAPSCAPLDLVRDDQPIFFCKLPALDCSRLTGNCTRE
jgi:hypothetical protein